MPSLVRKKPKQVRRLPFHRQERNQRFAAKYVEDFNAVAAARHVGLIDDSKGWLMLKQSDVQKRIKQLLKPIEKEKKLNQESIYSQLSNFLFYDIAQYYDEDGNLTCAPADLPPELRQCIVGVETIRRYDKKGNHISTKRIIKLVDKIAPLKMAMEAMKLLTQEHHHTFDWGNLYEEAEKNGIDTIEGEFKQITSEILDAHAS